MSVPTLSTPATDTDVTAGFLIVGGTVIDPANSIDSALDVAVGTDGLILEVGLELASKYPAAPTYDATGRYVVPGLVDLHTHVYEACTPISVDPDESCLSRGVTTAVDAGSAGASTFPGFKKFIIQKCKTRVLAFLNIALEGLAWAGMAGNAPGGELDVLAQIAVEPAIKCIEEHRDVLVGVKVRLTADVAFRGENEPQAYSRAKEVAGKTNTPLMTHHAMSSIDLIDCPGTMRKGDIYTHTYHGWNSTITDQGGLELNPACIAARERGVLFDVGHGAGAFNWTVAEAACRDQGFWPDVISTDLHKMTNNGPAYDLPTVMTKFHHLGMSLDDIIAAVTSTPAAAIGRSNEFGALSKGMCADITILDIIDVEMELEDVHRQVRDITKLIKPAAVWRNGVSHPITAPDPFPNPQSGDPTTLCMSTLKVRDLSWKAIMERNNVKCC